MGHMCFVSYARVDFETTPRAKDFMDRLGDAIARLEGTDRSSILYRDSVSIKAGSRWCPEVERALYECTFFIPLLSQAYFGSEYCGKEWTVFERRMVENQSLQIVPIMWTHRSTWRNPPECVLRRQGYSELYGSEYCESGVASLLDKHDEQGVGLFIDAFARDLRGRRPRTMLPSGSTDPSKVTFKEVRAFDVSHAASHANRSKERRQRQWTETATEGFRESLASYRQYLASYHQGVVPFFADKHRYLQQVTIEVEEAQAEPGAGSSLRLETLLRRRTSARWAILGDPGAGKTTLARQTVWQLATRTAKEDGPLAVYVRLPECIRNECHPFDMAEIEVRQASRAEKAAGVADALWEQARRPGKIWILLDCLDEIRGASIEKTSAYITGLVTSSSLAHVPIAVFGRPIGYQSPHEDFQVARIRELAPEIRSKLLCNWLGEKTGRRLFERISSQPSLRSLCGNPLMLTLVAKLATTPEDLPRRRDALYSESVDLLLTRGAELHQRGVRDADVARRILGKLALRLMRVSSRRWLRSELNATVGQLVNESESLGLFPVWRSAADFLDDVARSSGLLGPHDGEFKPWRFLHPIFCDFLAAEELSRRGDRELAAFIGKISSVEFVRWSETLAILAAMLVRPETLLARFKKSNPKQFVRLLPTIEALTPRDGIGFLMQVDDWDSVELGSLVESWRERGESEEKIADALRTSVNHKLSIRMASAIWDCARKQRIAFDSVEFSSSWAKRFRTRFAPAPSGRLHVGSIRIAILNALCANYYSGDFLLRVDDTDPNAISEEGLRSIYAALDWFQLHANSQIRQSQRLAIYERYVEKLRKIGAAYPCFCSEERLKEHRTSLRKSARPSHYDGRCLKLNEDEIRRMEEAGTPFTIRFRVPEGTTVIRDRAQGMTRIENSSIGDFVIMRSSTKGQMPTLNFCCAIDDALLSITHVVRGSDHTPENTAKQLMILRALSFEPPEYAHVPMVLDSTGRKLSKRDRKRSGAKLDQNVGGAGMTQKAVTTTAAVEDLQRKGYFMEPLRLFLALASNPSPKEDWKALTARFSFEMIGRRPTRFDEQEIRAYSRNFVRRKEFEWLWQICRDYLQSEDLLQDFARSRRAVRYLASEIAVLADLKRRGEFLFVESTRIDYCKELGLVVVPTRENWDEFADGVRAGIVSLESTNASDEINRDAMAGFERGVQETARVSSVPLKDAVAILGVAWAGEEVDQNPFRVAVVLGALECERRWSRFCKLVDDGTVSLVASR